jgi:putative tricarboxylic transport membrane protein
VTAVDAGRTARPARLRVRLGARTIFFGLLVVLFAGYLQMALGMEWRTTAGRIGPGFFPRVIGVLGLALALVALVRSLRTDPVAEDEPADDREDGEADLGRHPRTLAIIIGACAAFAATYVLLGALVAGAVFLFGCLWLLNRPRPLFNAALSIGVAVGLYLLFETLLDAGLPAGVLPL